MPLCLEIVLRNDGMALATLIPIILRFSSFFKMSRISVFVHNDIYHSCLLFFFVPPEWANSIIYSVF